MNRVCSWRFSKMHGAGNDVLIIDLRGQKTPPDADTMQRMGDRHRGIGFDQLLSIEDSPRSDCIAAYRIWNSDGSAAQQCGNGARCVAAWLHRDGVTNSAQFQLHSPAGVIAVERLDNGDYRLAMGRPNFSPPNIPFLSAITAPSYRLSLALPVGDVEFSAVSMGNPHITLIVDDVATLDIAPIARALQARPEFPEGVNVGFAQVLSRSHIKLRVFERGVGETLACGSGTCAAVANLIRLGRLDRRVEVDLPGGRLTIAWPHVGKDDDSEIVMSGPATFVFEGEFFV